jgi:hypothetical protein
MRLIPSRKSRPKKAADTILNSLKLGAIIGAVQGATKGAAKGGSKGVKRVARKSPTKRAVPIAVAAGGVGVVAVRKLRSSRNGSPSQQSQATAPPVTASTTPS